MNTDSVDILKILVVEDDAIILYDIKEVLEAENFHVITAINPGQALIHLNNGEPDLVVMDINLESELTGIDLARYIMDNNIPVPYIFLTSYSDKKTIEQVKGTFPAAYIAKPFHQAQLLSTVSLVLAGNRKRILNFGLTPEQLRAKINVDLTEKEWSITQLLSQGLSNENIGGQLNLSVNTVKFHIKNIYDKLEVHNRPELILKLGKLSRI